MAWTIVGGDRVMKASQTKQREVAHHSKRSICSHVARPLFMLTLVRFHIERKSIQRRRAFLLWLLLWFVVGRGSMDISLSITSVYLFCQSRSSICDMEIVDLSVRTQSPVFGSVQEMKCLMDQRWSDDCLGSPSTNSMQT